MKFDWLNKLIPFNQGSPKVQAAVLVLLVLLIAAFATKCRAEEPAAYAQIGVGSTYMRGEAAAIDLSFVYPDAAPADSVLEVGATFIGASDCVGCGGFQRNNFALRAAIVDGLGPVEVGLGFAYLQNTDTYNGSHLNFNLILGYRFARVPITLRFDSHLSNGGTQSPNKGRDMAFIIWRF